MRRRRKAITAVMIATVLLSVTIIILYQHSSGSRPPELIQAGDSKTRCLNVGLGAPLRQVDQVTGIDFTCLETFTNMDPTWSSWVSPWVTHKGYGYKTWLAADPTRRQIIMTQNLVPTSAAKDADWTANCAAGDYNVYARELARNLVATGFGYAVLRLGAEMNGTWNVGSLGTTVKEWHQWGLCFAQEVETMRGIRGSHFLFDWDINANFRDISLAAFYPGNSYVDIIGIDAYDASSKPLPRVGSTARWAALTSEADGLDAIESFAVAHQKPLSIPEWATVAWQGADQLHIAWVLDLEYLADRLFYRILLVVYGHDDRQLQLRAEAPSFPGSCEP